MHFGHHRRRWNPKMGKYIFGARNNIHIIDLHKTVKELKKAVRFAKSLALEGRTILFVGTKKQAQETVAAEAVRCGAFSVTHRWLGGTLTNFATLRRRLKRLDELEQMEREGIFGMLSKKEVARFQKEHVTLQRYLTGVIGMDTVPGALFIVDPDHETTAVKEARKMGVPILAVVDTNCDPDLIDYPIPGNDDAVRSIKLFTSLIADAIIEGREERGKAAAESAPPDAAPALEPVAAETTAQP